MYRIFFSSLCELCSWCIASSFAYLYICIYLFILKITTKEFYSDLQFASVYMYLHLN